MPKPTFIRWQEVKHMPRRRIPAKVKETLKKGVSIGQLYRSAMRFVDFQNAKYVKPFKVEKLVDKQGRNVYRAFTHTNDPRYPPERDHAVTIRPRDINYKGKITECPAVVLECSCMRNCFKWEFANAIHGDGLIWRGNGEPPNVTNPRRIFGSCKHGVSLMKWLIQRRM